MTEKQIQLVSDAYKRHTENPDWYGAMLSYACTQTENLEDAIAAADSAFKENPSPPEFTDDEEQQAQEELAEQLSNIFDDDISLSTDAEGHEHRGKGKDGGQFTSKGEGGSTRPDGNIIDHPKTWQWLVGKIKEGGKDLAETISNEVARASKKQKAITKIWERLGSKGNPPTSLEELLGQTQTSDKEELTSATTTNEDNPFTSGKPVTWNQIKSIIESLGNGSVRAMAPHLAKMLEQTSSSSVEKTDEMQNTEVMKSVIIGGTEFYWTAKSNHMTEKAAQTILRLASKKTLIPLVKATKTIHFTQQANKNDSEWAKMYNIPNFAAPAIGGAGTICVFSSGNLDDELFAHEAGHNLASKIFGGITPTPDSEYGKAQTEEQPVTNYGRVHPSEDFADACAMYANSDKREYMRRNFPKKYAAIHNIMNDPKNL